MERFCQCIFFYPREDICSSTLNPHERLVYGLPTWPPCFSIRAEDGRQGEKNIQKIQNNHRNHTRGYKKMWGQAQAKYRSFFQSVVITCCCGAKKNGCVCFCTDYRALKKIIEHDVYQNWWFPRHLPRYRVPFKPRLPLRIFVGSGTQSLQRKKSSSIHARRSLGIKRDAILSVEHSSHIWSTLPFVVLNRKPACISSKILLFFTVLSTTTYME